MYELRREALIPAPRDEVFEFFHNPRNLRRITPKSLGFKITAIDDLPVKSGFRISYTIRPLVLPMAWTTTITEWDPPRRFADVQTKGPYKSWLHEHTFEDAPGGTLMRDVVQYELPFGILGAIAHRLIVARQLKHIFDYRARRIRKTFAKAARATMNTPGGRP